MRNEGKEGRYGSNRWERSLVRVKIEELNKKNMCAAKNFIRFFSHDIATLTTTCIPPYDVGLHVQYSPSVSLSLQCSVVIRQ